MRFKVFSLFLFPLGHRYAAGAPPVASGRLPTGRSAERSTIHRMTRVLREKNRQVIRVRADETD
jgi:hypothetical protein